MVTGAGEGEKWVWSKHERAMQDMSFLLMVYESLQGPLFVPNVLLFRHFSHIKQTFSFRHVSEIAGGTATWNRSVF